MLKYDVYNDISVRTGGDVYIGVVGPVRTGKSTFITKFMEKLVLPNISNKLQKQIATDEMPQSADGKTIMTTQPKFIPANSVKVQFKSKASLNVRLVDCVGYMVEGAVGHLEDEKPRLVKTPWEQEEIPFEKAAEIGTKKVIDEYSTIGVVVTSDGSFGELKRKDYLVAEERVVSELKNLDKPFVIILNSANPESKECIELATSLEEKYGVFVIAKNVTTLEQNDISEIMEKILLEFPMSSISINLPKWMQVLPNDNEIIKEIISVVKERSSNVCKMKDFAELNTAFNQNENVSRVDLNEIKLSYGNVEYSIVPKEDLYYKILSKECGNEIKDDYELMSFIRSFSEDKKSYDRIKNALKDADENGYGVVFPSAEELNLEEPLLVKKGGKYGVKLKASAPSLHILKVDVATEVSPVVGTEQQGEDLVNSLMARFEDNPAEIWKTNMFGKSLHDLVNDGLSVKLTSMPIEVRNKMRKTLSRVVNENRGGIICILL